MKTLNSLTIFTGATSLNFNQAAAIEYTSSSPVALAFSSNVNEGDLLVVGATFLRSAPIGISDTLGSLWIPVASTPVDANYQTFMWCAVAKSSGTDAISIPFTTSGSFAVWVVIGDWSSTGLPPLLDGCGFGHITENSPLLTVTTTPALGNADLLIAVAEDSQGAIATPSGWIRATETVGGALALFYQTSTTGTGAQLISTSDSNNNVNLETVLANFLIGSVSIPGDAGSV